VLRSGDQYPVDVLHREQFFSVLDGPWSSAVVSRIRGGGFVAVPIPQIADHGHLHVMTVLQLGGDQVEIPATASITDVPEGNPVVGADNVFVGQSGAWQNDSAGDDCGGLAQECPTIDLRGITHD
jgi:hypothetical protein